MVTGGFNPPLVTAYTKGRTAYGKCQGYVAVSSPVGAIQYQAAALATWRAADWIKVSAKIAGDIPIIDDSPNYSPPVTGHAERRLYEFVTNHASITAIDASQKPCTRGNNSCYSYFTSLKSTGLQLAYWDTLGPKLL